MTCTKSSKGFSTRVEQCDAREVLELYQATADLQGRANWTVIDQQKGELTKRLMKVARGNRRDQKYTNTQTKLLRTVDAGGHNVCQE
jgi:hypothetical protein